MTFIVSGMTRTGELSETRALPASAIVLAAKWEARGVADVTIRNDGKPARSLDMFRREQYPPRRQ